MKLLVLLAIAGLAAAQERPAFEVASAKVSTSGATGMSSGGGAVRWQGQSLRQLVQRAYRLHDYDYSGPGWLDTVYFDIDTKLPAGANFNQLPEMLQSLLVERFQLVVHRAKKQIPGLALSVDRKGARIQPVDGGGNSITLGATLVQGTNITMAQFAEALAGALGRPVKDLTSLAGGYDIKIRWTPDLPATNAPSDLAPSVYDAVRELGLRLEARKVPVEIVVVDRAERVPRAN